MSEAKHSATPWDFTVFSKPDGSGINTPQDVADTVAHSAIRCAGTELWGVSLKTTTDDGSVIVVCYTGNGPTSEENAEFITRACNSHDDLLVALKEMVGVYGVYQDKSSNDRATHAIAKAEGR